MRQQWADYRIFLREFRRTFKSTGAVLPSGTALSTALAHYVRGGASMSGRRFLEVGPGTGAVTGHIVRFMRNHDHLDLVECNHEFVTRLRNRLQNEEMLRPCIDRITLHHTGIEELGEDSRYDVIVSGLPLNNFPAVFVEQLISKLIRLLAPGGTLSFFEYIAIRWMKTMLSSRAERERLQGQEGKNLIKRLLATHEIHRKYVLTNVPPAWVYYVRHHN